VIRLPKCTLCDDYADPRCGVWTRRGFYALCDGCAPYGGRGDAAYTEDIERVSARCRATDRVPTMTGSRFAPADAELREDEAAGAAERLR
jgi:hypothetical protein